MDDLSTEKSEDSTLLTTGPKKISVILIEKEPEGQNTTKKVEVTTDVDIVTDTKETDEGRDELKEEVTLPATAPEVPTFDDEILDTNSEDSVHELAEEAESVEGESIYGDDAVPNIDTELEEMLKSVDIQESTELDKKLADAVQEDHQILEQASTDGKLTLKSILGLWWYNPLARYGSLVAIFVAFLVVAVVPTTRYSILNTAGVKVSAVLKVYDAKNNQPLQGAEITIGNQSVKTGSDGIASLQKLPLGKVHVTIKKRAFAQKDSDITLGWGSNPIDNVKLEPTGSRVSFELVDWLSAKPLDRAIADVSYLDSTVTNNDKGIAELTLEPSDAQDIKIRIKAPHYQEVMYKLDTSIKDTIKIKMVADDRHYYMSRRSGTYDLYSSFLDGKDEKLILAGTGLERDDLVLSTSPDSTWVALVSTRDGERNKDGYLKSSLTLIDTSDDTYPVKKIANSERVQLIGWYEGRLVYVRVADGASATNPKRHRLVSYDLAGGGETEIAASNYFNDVLSTKEYVFFAPSNAYQENPQPFLFRVKPDGSDKQKMTNTEVWNIFRLDYDTLVVAYQQDWFSVDINTKASKKLDGQPSNLRSKLYTEGSTSTLALWQEERDGKGTLLSYDFTTKKDTVLLSQSGLASPVQLLRGRYIVYRVVTPNETADYVMPVGSSTGTKIIDVSKTGSIDRWYYY